MHWSPAIVESFEGSFRGFSEEARTRGFPSPLFGPFGLIVVTRDLSIVAAWRIGSGSTTAALGCGLNGSTQHSLETEHPGLRARGFCRRVIRAGAASAADGRTDISKSRFAMEPPSKQAIGLSV